MSMLRVLLIGSCGLCVATAVIAGSNPVAVSPGDDSKLVLIADPCPTFTWGQVKRAQGYELVVYRMGEDGEEAEQVLTRRITASALAWTPAVDDCLARGGRYAWSVRALGAGEASGWSAPSLFQVAEELPVAEALAVVRDFLSEGGSLADLDDVAPPPRPPTRSTGPMAQVSIEDSLSDPLLAVQEKAAKGAPVETRQPVVPSAPVPLRDLAISAKAATTNSGTGGDAIAVRGEYRSTDTDDHVVGYLGVATSDTSAGEFDGFPQLEFLDRAEIGVLGFSADGSDNYGVVGVSSTLGSSAAGLFFFAHESGSTENSVYLSSGNHSVLASGQIEARDFRETCCCGLAAARDPDTDHCFLIVHPIYGLSYPESREHCAYHGGYLATITSDDEAALVSSLLPAGANAWIGYSDARTEGSFEWVTGEVAVTGQDTVYTRWHTGEPNDAGPGGEDCVLMAQGDSGNWYDWSCDDKLLYLVCEKDL